MKQYYVYILTTQKGTVYYTGVTNDLVRRAWEHRNKMNDGYTKLYNINKLVYYEAHQDVRIAIEREKQIKGWSRLKKGNLIANFNPEFQDLWYKATH